MDLFNEKNKEFDDIFEKLSENSISNYVLPFSVAPNFLINNKLYFVPMVTEESSVVAAAAYASKFWYDKGGFKVRITGTKKTGQIYFTWKGDINKLKIDFHELKEELLEAVKSLLGNMEKRGGGITNLFLVHNYQAHDDYFIINVDFETIDSMGANLINSCLEAMTPVLKSFIKEKFGDSCGEADIIMAILSNYTPECHIECGVECNIDQLSGISGDLSPAQFAGKFEMAVRIANENIQRAVTHNKGIFNGIDAVLLATGNDFRAVEACGHAYAAKDGTYKALTHIEIKEKKFRYSLKIPLSLGTVGGATSVHPIAKMALQILQNPNARELMGVVAATGLASNFAAIISLISGGIQKGHMKLHLNNILYQLNASADDTAKAKEHFKNKQVSYKAVSDFLNNIRIRA